MLRNDKKKQIIQSKIDNLETQKYEQELHVLMFKELKDTQQQQIAQGLVDQYSSMLKTLEAEMKKIGG